MRKFLAAAAIVLSSIFGLLSPASPVHATSYRTCDPNNSATPAASNPYIAFWYIRSEIYSGVGGTYVRRFYTYYYNYISTTILGNAPYVSTTTYVVSCSKLISAAPGGGGSGGW